MFAQVWDVLKENYFVPDGNVVGQNQMLRQLPHVADMRHDRHAEFPAEQTHGDEFTGARHTHGVHLNEAGALGLQIIFEDNAVRHVLAERELRRRDGESADTNRS